MMFEKQYKSGNNDVKASSSLEDASAAPLEDLQASHAKSESQPQKEETECKAETSTHCTDSSTCNETATEKDAEKTAPVTAAENPGKDMCDSLSQQSKRQKIDS